MERCRICGATFESLTYEHVPPKSAFNDRRVRITGLEEWLRRTDNGTVEGGRYLQRGAGNRTLCGECNSLTGAWFVPEYTAWAERGVFVMRQLPPSKQEDRDENQKLGTIGFGNVYPLRFLKQVVAMILSVNGPEFGDANTGLRAFVQDRSTRELSGRYQFYLALYRGPSARFAGLSGSLHLVTGAQHFITEIAYPPFAVLLSIDEKIPFLPIGNITGFKSFGYDERADIELSLLVGFGHTPFPGDFRSSAAVERDRASGD